MTDATPRDQRRRADRPGPPGVLVRAATSLPGKLLGLAVAFVLLAKIMIFIPSAADYRADWLGARAEAAHLAAIAGEAGDLSEAQVGELLEGVDALLVARVSDGMNQRVLARADEPVDTMVVADLRTMGFWESLVETCHTFFAPPGRHIRIIAEPETRPGEEISVVVPEAGLKRDLYTYSLNILWLSIFISAVTGGLIYLSLLIILVRPMRRLARAMTAFQADPSDPVRAIAPSRRRDEIGDAETALAAMQSDVRNALRSRERLAALGAAVAKINHDLRNVLSSAQLISDRLAMSSDARVAAMGERLVRAVDRGVRLCQETLDYGRSEEREPETQACNLRNALDDAAGDAFSAVGASDWENRVDEALTVLADPDHLHRIFLNLFRNALQAMERSDPRVLSVEAEASAAHEGGRERIAIRVRDTGPGLPERALERLFEPFSASSSKGGAGLGLSIARELARAMGGDVALHHTGEDGAVFEVVLKRA